MVQKESLGSTMLGKLAPVLILSLLLGIPIVLPTQPSEQKQKKDKVTIDNSTESITIKSTIKAKPQPKPPTKQEVALPIGKEAVVKLIQYRFGTDPRILALVNCESGFSTDIVSPVDINGYVNVGLFQINMSHGKTRDYWKNVDNNIQKAWELSNGGVDWNPWPTCKYTAGLV